MDFPNRAASVYLGLPLFFEASTGRAGPGSSYTARGIGYTLYVSASEAALSLQATDDILSRGGLLRAGLAGSSRRKRSSTLLRMQLVGASPRSEMTAENESPAQVSSWIGNDPKQWRARVRTFARVSQRSVYPGIDVVYRGTQRQLGYDFILAAGAEAGIIRMRFTGAQQVSIAESGALVLKTTAGELQQRSWPGSTLGSSERRGFPIRPSSAGAATTRPPASPWTARGMPT